MKTRSLNNSSYTYVEPCALKNFPFTIDIRLNSNFFPACISTAQKLSHSCGAMSYGIAKPGGFWKRPINRTYHYNFEVRFKPDFLSKSRNLGQVF